MPPVPFTFRRKGPADPALRSTAPKEDAETPPAEGPLEERPFIFSVTGLQRKLREGLERSFGNVFVGGEISSLTLHGVSGHAYFTLKDSGAQLRCVMWREQVAKIGAKLENGQECILRGRLTIFEKSGQLQMTVLELQRQGDGAAEEAYRSLAEKLRKEGLTAADRKRPIPKLPRAVGIVTSKSGAALRDVLRASLRRDPFTPILLSTCTVQGEEAPFEIAEALRRLDRTRACDVILLVRGGGSREDLWAFNSESLARAIAASKTPVVTGIGHETDTTIADLVADHACSTPTAAAEHVVPLRSELRRLHSHLQNRLHRAMRTKMHASSGSLLRLQNRLAEQDPQALLHRRAQHLDELTMRAERCLRIALAKCEQRNSRLQRRLARCEPRAKIAAYSARIQLMRARLKHAFSRKIEAQRQELAVLLSRLESLSPVAVLARGYAFAKKDSGQLVRSPSEVTPGERLTIRVAHGEIMARVEEES